LGSEGYPEIGELGMPITLPHSDQIHRVSEEAEGGSEQRAFILPEVVLLIF
jgi:hypothetical protein